MLSCHRQKRKLGTVPAGRGAGKKAVSGGVGCSSGAAGHPRRDTCALMGHSVLFPFLFLFSF